ncbi:MAG: PEP-CTERM-box response regulator transcription factor [Deltaproteobacteria bacterium]
MEKKLLIIDDQESIRIQLKWAFAGDYNTLFAGSVESAIKLIERENPPVVLLDLSLIPGGGPEEGMHVLAAALRHDSRRKVIVITGHDTRENALKAINMGAYDFCSKPVDLDELGVIVKRAFKRRELEEENEKLREGHYRDSVFLTRNPYLLDMLERVKDIARADVTVLITGESGTGKELIAKMIYENSARADKPFVAVNCGGIPDTLIESELFGYEKGAFTGADTRYEGKIERAAGGTLFLDEIAEMPLLIQPKILRFLQEREIDPLGGGGTRRVDVRLITATNRNLKAESALGTFRSDLFYRVSVVNFSISPLRERAEDIEFLADYFLKKYSAELKKPVLSFSDSAVASMKSYGWPGNVRELQNVVKGAVLLAQGRVIESLNLQMSVEEIKKSSKKSLNLKDMKDLAEKECVEIALERTGGNISDAAELIGISRGNVYILMKKHNIKQ